MEEKKYLIGVDIGGTKTYVCITNKKGQIYYKIKIPSSSNTDEIIYYINHCMKKANLSLGDIISIGVGVPGIITKDGKVINVPAFQWNNLELKKELNKYFDIPIFITNDVNCAALGEEWLGAAKDLKDYVYISLGTGVGCATVSNGKLIEGSKLMAGELGYLLTDEDELKEIDNDLGKYGTYEKKIAGKYLEKRYGNVKKLFHDYKEGEEVAQNIINQFIIDLSKGLTNLICILNPEKIIIGGGISESLLEILNDIRKVVGDMSPIRASIELAFLGEESGAIGAAAFGLSQFNKRTNEFKLS